jgi:hypothetical protein
MKHCSHVLESRLVNKSDHYYPPSDRAVSDILVISVICLLGSRNHTRLCYPGYAATTEIFGMTGDLHKGAHMDLTDSLRTLLIRHYVYDPYGLPNP